MVKEKTVCFPICLHFHQPTDNFEWVIEDCYQKSYEPLIDNMYQFEDVKFTLHFSGNLLEWFLKNKPDFIIDGIWELLSLLK